MSRSDLAPAYTCGTYHRRGLKGCTSHHIRVDRLDELLKSYVRKLADSSAAMLEQLNEELKRENDQVAETEQSADNLAAVLADLTEELKVTKRQRIREIMKKPEQEASIEALYDEMEADLQKKIDGIHHQIDLLSDKRNTVIQVNRVAKTAIDVFRDILEKDKLERNDLELLIDKILVYEDHLEIKLQSDIDTLLRCGTLPAETENAANFNSGTENIKDTLIQSSKTTRTRFFVSVLSAAVTPRRNTGRGGSSDYNKRPHRELYKSLWKRHTRRRGPIKLSALLSLGGFSVSCFSLFNCYYIAAGVVRGDNCRAECFRHRHALADSLP